MACQRLIEGDINEGERWVVAIDVEEEADGVVSCSIGEPRLTLRDPNIALVLRDSLLARLPLRPPPMAAGPSPTPLSSPTPTPARPHPRLPPLASVPTPVQEVLGVVIGPSPGPSATSPPRLAADGRADCRPRCPRPQPGL